MNSGILLEELTVESVKKTHDSVLRNPLIANVFYVRGLIEKWGTGTNKIIESCKEEHLPEPQFSIRTGGLVVVFPFASPLGEGASVKQKELTIRQQNILNFIRLNKHVSTQQIFDHIQKISKSSLTKKTVLRDLNYLELHGFIVPSGQTRARIWKTLKSHES